MQKNILKDSSSFLLLSILLYGLITLTLNSCEDKKNKHSIKIPTDNSTELSSNKKKEKKRKKSMPFQEKNFSSSVSQQKQNSFVIHVNGQTYTLFLDKQHLHIKESIAPLILINLFNPNYHACISQVKAFKDLENAYQKKLKILTLWEKNNNIIHFSNIIRSSMSMPKDLPLTLLYKNGKIIIYFEGITPIEMIKHSIQNAI